MASPPPILVDLDDLDRRITESLARVLQDRAPYTNAAGVVMQQEETATSAGVTDSAQTIMAGIARNTKAGESSNTALEDTVMGGLRRATERLEHRMATTQLLLFCFYGQSIVFIARTLGHLNDTAVLLYLGFSILIVLGTLAFAVQDMKVRAKERVKRGA